MFSYCLNKIFVEIRDKVKSHDDKILFSSTNSLNFALQILKTAQEN